MSIGYASIHIGSNKTKLSSLTLKNASFENLQGIIRKNLLALKEIIQYNINHKIRLFRISSDIIPFGSHPVNYVLWEETFLNEFREIGEMINRSKIRVSMHPGQYTVLNSKDQAVVERSIKDLEYHCRVLDALGCDTTCKIVLHIGGVYGDKRISMQRFVDHFKQLSLAIKSRLVIENDDRSYTIEDVMWISEQIQIPVVFDVLHHEINKSRANKSIYEWIECANKTWKECDGIQKIHYSQQNSNGKRGAHSRYIECNDFISFYSSLFDKNIDIMLEVKDKNLSAVKCQNLINSNLHIKQLEKEWAKYKYFVLSRSSHIYNDIRELLKEKSVPLTTHFYYLIEQAIELVENKGAEVNAAQHIWGYVNNEATERVRKAYFKLVNEYQHDTIKVKLIKSHLFKCAIKQNIEYLIESLYFYI